MTKRAFDKIAAGLVEATLIAQRDAALAEVTAWHEKLQAEMERNARQALEIDAALARVAELEKAAMSSLEDLWRVQDAWREEVDLFHPTSRSLNCYYGAVNTLRHVMGGIVKP